MAAHLKWTMYVAFALSISSFVTSTAHAQQSPWPAYGAAAGRIVIRPRVQQIRWRPAHSFAVTGTAVLPAGVFTVGVGTTPATSNGGGAATDNGNGNGQATTFDQMNKDLKAPGTCSKDMPKTCTPAAAKKDLTPPAPKPRAVEPPAPKGVPFQKGTPAQKSGPEQKASPAQKAVNLNLELHKMLANSKALLQELQEGPASEVYVARSAIDQR